MPRWVESVERVIPAPPERIWALVADPRRHQDISGNNSVRDAVEAPDSLALGSTFQLKMELSGAKYAMVSTVIEYDENRRIAWQSRPPADAARWRHVFGGRIWRYELEPVDGGTRVRESWDLSQEGLRWVVWAYRWHTRANMTATLQRIEQLAASDG